MTSMVLLVRTAASGRLRRRTYAGNSGEHRILAPDCPARVRQAASADAPIMLRPTDVRRTVRFPIAGRRALRFGGRNLGEPDLLVTERGRDLRLAIRLGQPDDLVKGELDGFRVADISGPAPPVEEIDKVFGRGERI